MSERTSKSHQQEQATVHPMIPVPDAIRIVLQQTSSILLEEQQKQKKEQRVERLLIDENLLYNNYNDLIGKILADDVLMSEPGYPNYNASIMDGYAIRLSEINTAAASATSAESEGKKNWTHQVIDKVFAGDDGIVEGKNRNDDNKNNNDKLVLPTAYYITTGAAVPDTYDCVVPVENCNVSNDKQKISFIDVTKTSNKWIRSIGCDMSPGSIVLPKGHMIDSISIGLLLQSGVSNIIVEEKKQPQVITVGVLSTGNELIIPNYSSGDGQQQQTARGKIPDVNRPVLLSLLSSIYNNNWSNDNDNSNKLKLIDLGIERDDDVEALTSKLRDALNTCDVIITTGGISMGESDILEDVFINKLRGTLHFGRLNMKPGKPTTFITFPSSTTTTTTTTFSDSTTSSFSTKMVFAMPGNPVSGIVCTQLLVKPCLDLMISFSNPCKENISLDSFIENNVCVHDEIQVRLTHNIKLDKERPEYHRVIIERDYNNYQHNRRGHHHNHHYGGDATTTTKAIYTATSTGVQRSSRLISLRDAEGLMVLPKGTKDKMEALKDEIYTVLLLEQHSRVGKRRSSRGVLVRDSLHLNPTGNKKHKKSKEPLKVGILYVQDPNTNTNADIQETGDERRLKSVSERVKESISSSSVMADVTIAKPFSSSADSNNVYNAAISLLQQQSNKSTQRGKKEPVLDVIVIVFQEFLTTKSSYQYHLDISSIIRKNLVKVSDAMSLQARRGGTGVDGNGWCGAGESNSRSLLNALFETVIGFVPPNDEIANNNNCCMMMFVPEDKNALEGSLTNIRGLVNHALQVGRG